MKHGQGCLYVAFATMPLMLMASSVHADRIYKWKDDTGRVIYSDKANPKMSEPVEVIPIAPVPTEQQVKEAQQLETKIKASADMMEQERRQRAEKRVQEATPISTTEASVKTVEGADSAGSEVAVPQPAQANQQVFTLSSYEAA